MTLLERMKKVQFGITANQAAINLEMTAIGELEKLLDAHQNSISMLLGEGRALNEVWKKLSEEAKFKGFDFQSTEENQ